MVLPLSAEAGQRSSIRTVPVFVRANVRYDKTAAGDSGLVRLAGGRLLLRRMTLPKQQAYTEVSLTVTVASAGDPWDKSGSLFLLHPDSRINFLNAGPGSLPVYLADTAGYPGITAGNGYLPAIELMRFITPFGAGFFSDHPKTADRRPAYIPRWEDSVVLNADVTQWAPLLQGQVWLGLWVDTWTKEGYTVSAELTLKQSLIPGDKAERSWVQPLANTVYYLDQRLPDLFARGDLAVPVDIPQGVSGLRLYYTVTGHGGYEGGDEFTPRENRIFLDDSLLTAFTPWRDDCASFRRFNPSAGVWVDTVRYQGANLPERIASSDFSRSNWCPGSAVSPRVIFLPRTAPGQHVIRISIPGAQRCEGEHYNHWLVSACLVGDFIAPGKARRK